jgi:hypothetical protein
MRFVLSVVVLLQLFGGIAWSQNLLVERGQAAVRVSNENYVRARAQALAIAKRDILTRSLSHFLEAESIKRLYPLLQNRLLQNPDVYIESTRIIEEFADESVQEFFLVLEARLYRSRISAGLKDLGILLQGESLQLTSVSLRYQAEPWVADTEFVPLFRSAFERRLEPYKIRLEDASVEAPDLEFFVRFSESARAMANEPFEPATVGVQLQLRKNEEVLATAYAQRLLTRNTPGYVISVLLDQLMLEWGTVLQVLRQERSATPDVRELEVAGLPNIVAEDSFLQALSASSGEGVPVLRRMTPNSISITGRFERKSVMREAGASQQDRRETINFVSDWNWEVDWKTNAAELSRVTEMSAHQELAEPLVWRVPENSGSMHELPQGVWIVDRLQDRSRNTWFQVVPEDESPESSKWVISWKNLDSTNLRPQIEILDGEFDVLHRVPMFEQGNLEFVLQQQKPGANFFIRVSDQIGYIEKLVGSYQFYHYALRLEKESNL